MKKQITHWEKISAQRTSHKWLLSKMYEEHLKPNKKTNLKNGAKTLIDMSPKKIYSRHISIWKDVC